MPSVDLWFPLSVERAEHAMAAAEYSRSPNTDGIAVAAGEEMRRMFEHLLTAHRRTDLILRVGHRHLTAVDRRTA
ncbi:hypothetical protein [Nocardia bhagyanarayanae]|uniref:Uncharacterized protein n=1 Tax=Nocardia bhagyanarayanae TaxID=1215925 RepID=A0A543FFU0_9NOCA|nr:hypothetical protein [Nocardia bhagyanarayanae]TQM32727.1 hypothetical protein FB390_4423 [Nocardia bhagyanarayanae]